MPELPEVETTRRKLEPSLVGREIAAVQTTGPSHFFLTPPRTLARRLPGRTVLALDRHGKYLLAGLDDGTRLLLHLGMTGQLLVGGCCSPRLITAAARLEGVPEGGFEPDRHTHLQLRFTDGGPPVLFRDIRRFGKVKLLAHGKSDARLDRLGPDALGATGELLREATRGRRSAIKCLLLDQSILAGVGNIYADEALFRAGIRPARQGGRLTLAECDALAAAVRAVLERGIETGGTSIDDFVAPDGSDGGYQDERRVYAREGEPCLACSATVRRLVLGGRSAHYCPACQR